MLIAAVGMLREAEIVQRPGVRAVVGGARADLLAERLEAAFDGDVRGVVSVGLCGALDPRLRVGDVVIGTEVVANDSRWATDAELRGGLTLRMAEARLTSVCGVDIMVTSSADKAKLRTRSGSAVVDMESHVAAARFAAAHGLPLAVLRVVSDEAGADLPPAVLHGVRPDGRMNLIGVLTALARRPGQLSALMRTGRDADLAFKALKAAWAASDMAL